MTCKTVIENSFLSEYLYMDYYDIFPTVPLIHGNIPFRNGPPDLPTPTPFTASNHFWGNPIHEPVTIIPVSLSLWIADFISIKNIRYHSPLYRDNPRFIHFTFLRFTPLAKSAKPFHTNNIFLNLPDRNRMMKQRCTTPIC